ncbi:hypothetical protein ACF0H5_016546 [Mactra antiquata]
MPKRKTACGSGEQLSKKSKRSTESTSSSKVKDSTANEEFMTPPSLRRAPTLTLDNDDQKDVNTASRTLLSNETKDLITSLLSLRSGATSGVSMFAPASSPSCSKQSKANKVGVTHDLWISSGLSKYILRKDSIQHSSFCMSKSDLMSGIGDAEFIAALMSLRSSSFKNSYGEMFENTGSSFQVSKSDLMSGIEDKEYSEALQSLQSSISVPFKTSINTSKSLTSGSKINLLKRSTRENEKCSENDDGLKQKNVSNNSMVLYGNDYMEVVIAFDISDDGLLPCIEHVCSKLDTLYKDLKTDIPGIRFGYMISGGTAEAMRWIDFGASIPEVKEFLASVRTGDTSNTRRCGPLDILRRTRQCFSWTPDSRRNVIWINSACDKKLELKNIMEEVVTLKEMDVKIYSVQLGNKPDVIKLNKEITTQTDGISLCITLIPCIYDTICMICLRETNIFSLKNYLRGTIPLACTLKVWKQLCDEDGGTSSLIPEAPPKIMAKPITDQTTKIAIKDSSVVKTLHDYNTRSKNKKTLAKKEELKSNANNIIIPSGRKKYSLRNTRTPKGKVNKHK